MDAWRGEEKSPPIAAWPDRGIPLGKVNGSKIPDTEKVTWRRTMKPGKVWKQGDKCVSKENPKGCDSCLARLREGQEETPQLWSFPTGSQTLKLQLRLMPLTMYLLQSF